MKRSRNILSLCTSLLVLFNIHAGFFLVTGSAATPYNEEITAITTTSGSAVTSLTKDRFYNIEFQYYDSDLVPPTVEESFLNPSITASVGSAFQTTTRTEVSSLKLKKESGHAVITGKIENIQYKKLNYSSLSFTLNANQPSSSTSYSVDLTFSISDYLGSTGGSGSSSGDSEQYTSDIVVERVLARGSGGEILSEITEDTPPFTLEIYFYDLGFEGVHEDDFYDRNFAAYLTSPGGLRANGSMQGRLVLTTLSGSGDFPRFCATFTNLTYDGNSNSITFRAQYYVDEYIYGEANATVHQAVQEEEEKEEGPDPATPYIILSNYSYGSQPIEAGMEFALDMSFLNTSLETPLENIVMKISTPEDLSIASSSNSYYIDSLGSDAELHQAIQLQAKPSAAVGSHSVTIEFTYQYIVDKVRKDNTSSFSVAIPVTQIDRFAVDPLTDYSEYVTQGDEAYLTLSFINRGKSTTYNISGSLQGDFSSSGQSQHFGNLEAGKSGTMEFSILCDQPGPVQGEVLILYEDENTKQKELSVPFSFTVEEGYFGDEPGPGPLEEEPPEHSVTLFTVTLCSLGGLLIAAPVALTLLKKLRQRGIEEFDEDF